MLRINNRKQRCFEQSANVFVAVFGVYDFVPLQNPAGVSVDYKNRVVSRIEQDRVRRFRPDSVETEQLFSHLVRRLREKFSQRSAILLIQEGHERFQPQRFLSKISRRTNQSLERCQRCLPNSIEAEQTR